MYIPCVHLSKCQIPSKNSLFDQMCHAHSPIPTMCPFDELPVLHFEELMSVQMAHFPIKMTYIISNSYCHGAFVHFEFSAACSAHFLSGFVDKSIVIVCSHSKCLIFFDKLVTSELTKVDKCGEVDTSG